LTALKQKDRPEAVLAGSRSRSDHVTHRLMATTVGEKSNAAEPKDHHRPSRRLGNTGDDRLDVQPNAANVCSAITLISAGFPLRAPGRWRL
jgi:hypothetical protein